MIERHETCVNGIGECPGYCPPLTAVDVTRCIFEGCCHLACTGDCYCSLCRSRIERTRGSLVLTYLTDHFSPTPQPGDPGTEEELPPNPALRTAPGRMSIEGNDNDDEEGCIASVACLLLMVLLLVAALALQSSKHGVLLP